MADNGEIRRLYEERNSKINEMRAIVDRADEEKRSLTAEDQNEIDSREEEINRIDSEVERREKVLKAKPAELRSMTGWTDDEQNGGVEEPPVPKTLTEYRRSIAEAAFVDSDEYRSAFFKMVSVRDVRELSGDELRTLSKATGAAGANLVPTEFRARLIDLLSEFGVMRDLSNVETTDTGDTITLPTVTALGTASWTAENAAYAASDDAFGQATLSAYKAGTIVQVSEELLVDSAFDLEGYLARRFADRIGILENTAYVSGNGTGKPTGITTTVTAGVTGGAGTGLTVSFDSLIDLADSVLPAYARNGTFLMNRSTRRSVRKLKDLNGQYIWTYGNGTQERGAINPETLLGYPVATDPDMPAMAINAKSILFGDFRAAYTIRDVNGVLLQRLNELYAGNGQVGFRMYHRTDGKQVDTNAVKAYQNGAS